MNVNGPAVALPPATAGRTTTKPSSRNVILRSRLADVFTVEVNPYIALDQHRVIL